MRHYGHFIGGQEVQPADGAYFGTDNPYSGETWAMIASGRAADVDAAVASAKAAGEGAWSSLTASARGKLLRRFADLVIDNADRLAKIEMTDNGKLAAEVIAQVKYMGEYFHYYAGLADKVEGHVIPTDKAGVFAYSRTYCLPINSNISRRKHPCP